MKEKKAKQMDTKAMVDYFLGGCLRGCLTEKGERAADQLAAKWGFKEPK